MSTYLNREQYERLEKRTMITLSQERAARTAAKVTDLEAIRFMIDGTLIHAVVAKSAVARVTGRRRQPENENNSAPAASPEATQEVSQ